MSCGRPMRFCAKLKRILPRRSSTARFEMVAFIDDHRDAYGGRADLAGSADRPIHLPRARPGATGSDTATGAGAAKFGPQA